MVNGKSNNYSTTKTYNRPWDKKTNIDMVKSKSKNKKKNARDIIYPLFEKCAALTNDKFWVSIFQNCARGKFPRYFSFKNNLLTYRKANKTKRILITNSPSEAFTTSIGFFQEFGGILSESDRKKRQKDEEERMLELANNQDLTWKDIKIDKIKEVLISEFIDDLSIKMEFNSVEKNELTTTIKKGFMLKYFSNDDVYMEDGRILEIDGLVFDKKNNQYQIDPDYIKSRPGRKNNGLGIEKSLNHSQIDFMELWSKYLENLEEKRFRKVKTYSSSYSSTNQSSDEYSSTSFNLPKNLSSTT